MSTTILEKVFRAHLTFKVVNIDTILKSIATNCIRSKPIDKPSDLFTHLKEYDEEFWTHFPGTSIILNCWIKWIASNLDQPIPAKDITAIRYNIWTNFIKRLGSEPSLICNTGKSKNPHGNILLQLFLQVVEETIYHLFSFDTLSEARYPEYSPPVLDQSNGDTNPYLDLWSENKYPLSEYGDKNTATFLSDVVPQDDFSNVKSRVFVPREDRNGLQVKLHRYGKGKGSEKNKKKQQKKTYKEADEDEDDDDDE